MVHDSLKLRVYRPDFNQSIAENRTRFVYDFGQVWHAHGGLIYKSLTLCS